MKEAPNFTAAASVPEINQALVYVLGFETVEELMKDYDAIFRGEGGTRPGLTAVFPPSTTRPRPLPAGIREGCSE